MSQLMSVLRKPGQLEQLRSNPTQTKAAKILDLSKDEPNQASLSDMIDALGDKMGQN